METEIPDKNIAVLSDLVGDSNYSFEALSRRCFFLILIDTKLDLVLWIIIIDIRYMIGLCHQCYSSGHEVILHMDSGLVLCESCIPEN